jgi:hypothetical protein
VFGHEEKDLAMRRWQTVREHPRRGFRDDTTITIDVDDSLLWLERRYLSEKERLMLLICVRHGDRNITVGELNRKVTEAVAEAGSMGAGGCSRHPLRAARLPTKRRMKALTRRGPRPIFYR